MVEPGTYKPLLCIIACDNIQCDKYAIFNPDDHLPFARCGRCRRSHFCSPECQKTNWPIHKPFCHPGCEAIYRAYIDATASLCTGVDGGSESNPLFQLLDILTVKPEQAKHWSDIVQMASSVNMLPGMADIPCVAGFKRLIPIIEQKRQELHATRVLQVRGLWILAGVDNNNR